jgi:aerobic-type carbon monoxide dehydrogenase small subunit (CoxS/CutS family)
VSPRIEIRPVSCGSSLPQLTPAARAGFDLGEPPGDAAHLNPDRFQTMNTNVQFTVNGKPQRVSTDSRRSLLEVLREDLGLTGTKYGCGEGDCRACTVLVDGKPTRSCLTEIGDVQDSKIETIESLAQGATLHPVQAAFIKAEAMQCGYCVPGMIMTAVGLLRSNSAPTREQIVEALNGNLCRCCGYINILQAVQEAAKSAREVQ